MYTNQLLKCQNPLISVQLCALTWHVRKLDSTIYVNVPVVSHFASFGAVECLTLICLLCGYTELSVMSTLSQRNTGLIQRKNISSAQGAEGGTNKQNEDENPYDEDEADHDSKETRLTLMEEILLLGLKDREVVT